jgi:hypothetical protein
MQSQKEQEEDADWGIESTNRIEEKQNQFSIGKDLPIGVVRNIAARLASVRPWENQRAAKKCKAKPCGNTCIATSKACLQGLTPEQKKLAQAAGKAMGAGKTGAAVDLLSPLVASTPLNETIQPPTIEANSKTINSNKIGGDPDYTFSPEDTNELNTKIGKGEHIYTAAKTGVKINRKGVNIEYYGTNVSAEKFYEITVSFENKINKEALDFVKKESSGRVFDVGWFPSVPAESVKSEKDKIKIARTAIKAWKQDFVPQLKNGDIVLNQPMGGAQGARARAYERSGYSKVHQSGYQFAIVKEGKLTPIQFHEFKEGNDRSN